MRKFRNNLVWSLMIVCGFVAGYMFNEWYYNYDSLYEANEFKREYLNYLEDASLILDSIIDTHADDGTLDEFVDELWDSKYYDLINKVDSMAATQL